MLAWLSRFPKQMIKGMIETAGLLRNPLTMGVRIIVHDENQRVLLVRHSYLKGWYLPGGGIETGETAAQSAEREVFEEVGIRALGRPRLLGLYLNKGGLGRDHVALFELEHWEPAEGFLVANREIEEARFFDPANLPDGATDATRRRLDELRKGAFPSGAHW